jgi:hypothetical protein
MHVQLDIALETGHLDIVQYLVYAGASLKDLNPSSRLPIIVKSYISEAKLLKPDVARAQAALAVKARMDAADDTARRADAIDAEKQARPAAARKSVAKATAKSNVQAAVAESAPRVIQNTPNKSTRNVTIVAVAPVTATTAATTSASTATATAPVAAAPVAAPAVVTIAASSTEIVTATITKINDNADHGNNNNCECSHSPSEAESQDTISADQMVDRSSNSQSSSDCGAEEWDYGSA